MDHYLATLLIVWHSRTTASQQLAFFAAQAAQETLTQMDSTDQVRILTKAASEVNSSLLLEADAYLFCAPENLGSLSGEMKAFFDRNYYAVLDQLNGRPYGLIISAGSDGAGAQQQAERICTGWRLQAIAPSLIVNTAAQSPAEIVALKTISPEQAQPAKEIGSLLAAHLALGLY